MSVDNRLDRRSHVAGRREQGRGHEHAITDPPRRRANSPSEPALEQLSVEPPDHLPSPVLPARRQGRFCGSAQRHRRQMADRESERIGDVRRTTAARRDGAPTRPYAAPVTWSRPRIRPAPVFTSLEVYLTTSHPDCAAATIASPLAWPTDIAVRALFWKNTCSITTTSGRSSRDELLDLAEATEAVLEARGPQASTPRPLRPPSTLPTRRAARPRSRIARARGRFPGRTCVRR